MTPHLVGLARRLEGKPFHLVASHCQRDTQENVVNYIKSKGLAADTPNVTVTSQGRHPKVKGNGYVPYYMVFDHHGTLIREHMCGDYHGGDGLAMIEWVDKLLADAPDEFLRGQALLLGAQQVALPCVEQTDLEELLRRDRGKRMWRLRAATAEDMLAAKNQHAQRDRAPKRSTTWHRAHEPSRCKHRYSTLPKA